MKGWSIRDYKRPYVFVDEIKPSRKGSIVLVAGDEEYEIDTQDGDGADHVVSMLRSLRDPTSPAWDQVRAPRRGDGSQQVWRELLQQMDQLALLREGGAAPASTVDRLRTYVDQTAEWIRAAAPGQKWTRLKPYLRVARQHLDWLSAELAVELGWHQRAAAVPRDPFTYANFYLRTLLLQARYWRRHSPLALLCADAALRRIANEPDSDLWDLVTELSNGLYSVRDLLAELNALARILVWTIADDAATVCTAPSGRRRTTSGVNFMLEAERLTSKALRDLGPSRYLTASADSTISDRLVKGVYIEEYHVTRRFVEIIVPTLAKRVNDGLRAMLFRYYAEEVGHERFERATCKSLGVDANLLDRSLPLPLHLAFVEVFTHFAETYPIGYLISIFVTEGMPGVSSPINDRLMAKLSQNAEFRKVADRHDSLNDDLNHESLSRLMMARVPSVPPATQVRALQHLLELVELNHRTWNTLYDYYSSEELPLHQAWFDGSLPND